MKPKTPKWQRIICGVLAAAGMIALPSTAWLAPKDEYLFADSFFMLIATSFGFFLFGFVAIKGRLPLLMQPPKNHDRQA